MVFLLIIKQTAYHKLKIYVLLKFNKTPLNFQDLVLLIYAEVLISAKNNYLFVVK
jgi:hypothetical protein